MAREDQKLQIQQTTDIVRLIGEQIALRPKGKEFMGLCPFHEDKNPSLHVSPTKQIYKCFSCGAGGDAYSFVMNYHKMTFPESLAYLAERAGIKLEPLHSAPHGGPGEEAPVTGPTDRQLVADANKQALEFFCQKLRHTQQGQAARQYIEHRHISTEMVERFQIGYAPQGWDQFASMIVQAGLEQHGFELAGLISQRKQDDTYYDRFRHRLIFPIFDAMGRPIAFGGRALSDQDEPKYLNSPETALFNKSATLYGLHLAKKSIIDSKTVVVVEGYTDVIACHQKGFTNVVATLGTALTDQHVSSLSRLGEQVVLIFDPDQAGQKAADRAVQLFLSGSLDVAVAILPDGLDPADLLAQSAGPEQWQQLVSQATGALEYKLDRMQADLAQTTSLAGRQKVAEQYLHDLANSGLAQQGILRRGMVMQRIARLLGLSENDVQALLQRIVQQTKRPGLAYTPSTPQADQESNLDNCDESLALPSQGHRIKALKRAQWQVVGCLLCQPQLFHLSLPDGQALGEAITPAVMVTPAVRQVYELMFEPLCSGQPYTLAQLLAGLAAKGEQQLIDRVTQIESQVQWCLDESPQQVESIAKAAAQLILNTSQEHQYLQARQAALEPATGGRGDQDKQTQLLNRIVEHHKANPSPVRIARVGHLKRGQDKSSTGPIKHEYDTGGTQAVGT